MSDDEIIAAVTGRLVGVRVPLDAPTQVFAGGELTLEWKHPEVVALKIKIPRNGTVIAALVAGDLVTGVPEQLLELVYAS